MAKINLDRLMPNRLTLAAIAGLLWAVSFGALRDFVWTDVRAGLIDLRGLTRATRALVWFGFGLLAAMVTILLFNDVLRAQFSLIAQVNGAPGRGALLPVALLPVSLFMLSIAWTFLLTGALHSNRLVCYGILSFYFLLTSLRTALLVLGNLDSRGFGNLNVWQALGLLLAVPLFFVLRRRARARPIFEYSVLLILVSLTYTSSQSAGVDAWHATGIPTTLAEMQVDIQLPGFVILPMLLFLGIDVANFARRASGWAVDIVTQRMARSALWIILAGVFIWRLRSIVQDTLDRFRNSTLSTEWPAYAGALAIPLLAGALWWLMTHLATRDHTPEPPEPNEVGEAAERIALPLIVIYFVSSAFVSLMHMTTIFDLGGLVVSIAALGVSAWFLRRGLRNIAAYLGIFSALSIWRELTKQGAPLGVFGGASVDNTLVDFWWVLLLALAALVWQLRQRLHPERGAQLLFLLLLTALIRQTSFIESPFSPILSFAGIGFIAFGIIWDVLTKGFWTNHGTPGLPRVGRLFLYMGYILLTVTMINWALTSHDLATLSQFTGEVADAGFGRFGKPLLYAIIVATLASPLQPAIGEEPSEPPVLPLSNHDR